jgi:hypothetical protein
LWLPDRVPLPLCKPLSFLLAIYSREESSYRFLLA